jgi:hypothetical protein
LSWEVKSFLIFCVVVSTALDAYLRALLSDFQTFARRVFIFSPYSSPCGVGQDLARGKLRKRGAARTVLKIKIRIPYVIIIASAGVVFE